MQSAVAQITKPQQSRDSEAHYARWLSFIHSVEVIKFYFLQKRGGTEQRQAIRKVAEGDNLTQILS